MADQGKDYLEHVDRLVKEVKYGTITIVIQDGKVIQIDKTEKIRLK
ncbi:MAG: YezD family protein [Lachnospiraceae bacterium]|nr:YezD family protein [Lachnospiraceae bacterium]